MNVQLHTMAANISAIISMVAFSVHVIQDMHSTMITKLAQV